MNYTLKLDASWRPISIIDSFKAVGMVLSGRAKVVKNYDVKITSEIFIPSVIVLNSYIQKHPFSISCNRKNVIIKRDDYTCQYCGKRYLFSDLTLDHVYPKSKGGKKEWTNIVTACKKCNSQKSNKCLGKTSLKLLKQPKKPKLNFKTIYSSYKFDESWLDFI